MFLLSETNKKGLQVTLPLKIISADLHTTNQLLKLRTTNGVSCIKSFFCSSHNNFILHICTLIIQDHTEQQAHEHDEEIAQQTFQDRTWQDRGTIVMKLRSGRYQLNSTEQNNF